MGSAWAAPGVLGKVGKMMESRGPSETRPLEAAVCVGGLHAPIRPDPDSRSPRTKPMPVLRRRRERGLRLGDRPA